MTNKAPEKKCFWIDYDLQTVNESKAYVNSIQVISADWVDWKIAEMQKEIDELKEALSFYANKSNWMRSWITNGEEIAASQWADKLKIQDCALLNCGGGRARLALSKHKPEDQNDNT